MGQQNSSAQDGIRNQEDGCVLNEPIKRELLISKKNDISESIQCVKARIDMLIEDCLTGNETLDGVSNNISSNGCCVNNIINDTHCSQCEVDNEKCVGAIENMWGKMRSGFESKEAKIIFENNEPKCILENEETKQMLESKQKEFENSDETKTGNKESLDKHGVMNDFKYDKEEKAVYLPEEKKTLIKKPHLVVSDLISDMVSSEISQNHLSQLQKRTVTTFNKFIDKVLDSSLKVEFMEKPTNIQKLGSETCATSDCVNLEIRKSPNRAVKIEKRNVTLEDHIETVLEESFQDKTTPLTRTCNINSTVLQQEKFNAHELVNNLIAQGLGVSKQNVEAKQVVNCTNKNNINVNSNTSQTFQNKIAEENLGRSPNSGVDEKLKFQSVNQNNPCVGKSMSANSNNLCVAQPSFMSANSNNPCVGMPEFTSANPNNSCVGKSLSANPDNSCVGKSLSANPNNVCVGQPKFTSANPNNVCVGQPKFTSANPNNVCVGQPKFTSANPNNVCVGQPKFTSANPNNVCVGQPKFISANPNNVCVGQPKFTSANPNNVCVGQPKFISANPNNVCVINERISMHSETSLHVSDQWYRDMQHNKERVVNEKSCYIKDQLSQGNRNCLKSLLNTQSQGCETYGSDSVLHLSCQMVSDSIHNTSVHKNHNQGNPNLVHEIRNTQCDGKKIIHIRHCQCTLCVRPCSGNILEMPTLGHYSSGKLSPNFPQHTSCPMLVHATQSQMNNMLPAMMRPTHGIPQGYTCNQGMPQHLPHHHPNVSNKVNFEKSFRTTDNSKVCLETVSMQEKSNMQWSYLTEGECSTNNDSQSGSSDSSLETPLDLTVVKCTKSELARQQSMTQRKITTPNAFIKHIENSVDRHWLGLTCPSHSPGISGTGLVLHRSQCSSSATLYDSKGLASTPSPNSTCSASSFSTLHAILPSPHLTGVVTTKQQLVDNKLPVLHHSAEHHRGDVLLTGPLLDQQQHQLQTQFPVNHSDFGTNGKLHLNNISKHEPLQNIIGHHDQNDILYLICRLCTQTYGSPYGFRKHFRNQHGFEPRAEHTIVQTISATKSVLHSPHTHLGSPIIQEDEVIFHRNVSPQRSRSELNNHNFDIPLQRKSISLSPPGFKVKNSELITEPNRSETKCLECPECGKSFQLNDFGSYKRHCRQHGNLKMNGPSTCSDCHLPFPDQKLLKEHYLAHAEDSLGMKQDRASSEKSLKTSSPLCYLCLQCDQQFDDLCALTQHKASHDLQVKQLESWEVVKIVKRSSPGNVQQETRKDVEVNFVTNNRIVVQAAESLKSLACSDSSCDNNNKNKRSDENLDEAGQKRGVKNCSNLDTRNTDSGKAFSQERFLNCNSNNSDNKLSDETEFMYKHKKFFHQCKRTRTISSNDLSEVTDSKVPKMIDGTCGNDLSQVTGSVLANNKSNGAKLEVAGILQVT